MLSYFFCKQCEQIIKCEKVWSVAPNNLSGFKKCSYEKTNEITNFVVILTPSAFIISCELWRCSIVTELKDFDSCWSVSHLSLVTCWHLFVILGYIIRWGFWIVFVLQGSRYIEVLFLHILLKLWSGWRLSFVISKNSLYRGLTSWFHCALSCIRPRRPVEFCLVLLAHTKSNWV